MSAEPVPADRPSSAAVMPCRRLGRTGLVVPALGFGAFKIGRNQGAKYPASYEVPDDAEAGRVLHAALDLGMRLIDTAPAYGLSEERIGRHLAARRSEYVLVTKVGERFDDQGSRYDFTPAAVEASVRSSVERLAGPVDLLLVHADAEDAVRARDAALRGVLERVRNAGLTRHIGFSGKGVAGNRAALDWAEVLMIEYHLDDRSAEPLLEECAARGVGVLVKKALGSGRLPAGEAIQFVLGNPRVDCVVVGGRDVGHLATNAAIAAKARAGEPC